MESTNLKHPLTLSFPCSFLPSQLADAREVVTRVRPGSGVAQLPVLTPNLKGFENAMAAGASEIAVFASASESFSRANVNCSVDESLRRYEAVCKAARERGVPVRG